MIRFVLAFLAIALLPVAALAQSAVPSSGVISSAGTYHLTSDRVSSGQMNIQIDANNVTLDLRGFLVRCAPAAPASAVTFGIKVNAHNAIIRNGRVSGCFMGIHAADVGNTTIEGIDFTGNTYIGLHGGATIRGNTFDLIKGYSTEAYSIGINAPVSGCRIHGNLFRNLHRQPGAAPTSVGEGVGVLLSGSSQNCTVYGNWFENDQLGPEADIGVWVAGGAFATVRENSFTNFGRAVAVAGSASVQDNRFWMRVPEPGSHAIGGTSTAVAEGNLAIGFESFINVGGTVIDKGNTVLP